MGGFANVECIERFHLAFLFAFSKRVQPQRYVLKGGANLRYFFGSVRYSEDIDLDADDGLHRALKPKVDDLLGGSTLARLLGTMRIRIVSFTAPKQTETTRRWKVELGLEGQRDPVRTKIEFSSRSGALQGRVEAVPREVVAPYGLVAPVIPHYAAALALAQKVRALNGRALTQARDVFDLDLLLRHHDLPDGLLGEDERVGAADRATALPQSAFEDQVLAFLERDAVELYADDWHTMVQRVVYGLVGS